MIMMAARQRKPPRPAIMSGHAIPPTKCRPTDQQVIDVIGGSETESALPHDTVTFISLTLLWDHDPLRH
jgi:hypothetical protein